MTVDCHQCHRASAVIGVIAHAAEQGSSKIDFKLAFTQVQADLHSRLHDGSELGSTFARSDVGSSSHAGFLHLVLHRCTLTLIERKMSGADAQSSFSTTRPISIFHIIAERYLPPNLGKSFVLPRFLASKNSCKNFSVLFSHFYILKWFQALADPSKLVIFTVFFTRSVDFRFVVPTQIRHSFHGTICLVAAAQSSN